LKILSFSYCYPNQTNRSWGVFVHQRLLALSKINELNVCSPSPWFPLLSMKTGNPGPVRDSVQGLAVYRPRFFYVPKMLKDQDARFYAHGIRRWLRSFFRDWRPDLLDAHFVWPDGAAIALLAKDFGLPYTITLRGKLYESIKFEQQKKQCADALKNASAVISVSKKLAEEAIKLGVTDERLTVIPNGVDRELLRPRQKALCRKELGLSEEGRILVAVAHLGHRKGHYEVIQALAGLPKDVRLVIVGGSAQGGTPEKLTDAATVAGVADRLILPGPQPHEKIPLYFGAADASVLASYREGCPNAVLESLACGTPVVASDVGAVRDILPDPECGRIVPPRAVGQLREALDDVLSKKWLPEDVVRASGVKSWDEAAADVQKVFEKIFPPDHACDHA